MKAIVLPAYQGNIIRALRSLEIQKMKTPVPLADEVLVKISFSPCNPSDLAFIQGGYNVKKSLPAIPGFEGSGRVIKSGNDAMDLSGKKISFFYQGEQGGAWASHILLKASDCLPLDESMPDEQAACFAVNPFTAFAMVDMADKAGSRALVQDAAAGQLARFIEILAKEKGIAVINIVRKEEQVSQLKSQGSKYVLWQQDGSFEEELNALTHELGAQLAFDAAGGILSGIILKNMPEGSSLKVYGALAGRTLSEIPAADVIFKKKSVSGFNMNEWKEKLGKKEFLAVSEELQKLFINGKLKTRIQGNYPLEEHGKALMEYIRNMSGGKVLLRS